MEEMVSARIVEEVRSQPKSDLPMLTRPCRLVFHAFLRDAQVSMTQFTNPAMAYAEFTLPLPCSRELWFARTAEEFKIRYLEVSAGDGKRLPSMHDLLRDINALSDFHHRLDVQFSLSIYLHAFWAQVWECRQLASVHCPPFSTTTSSTPHTNSATNTSTNSINIALLLDSRRAELLHQLKTFQLAANNHPASLLSAQEHMLLHFLLLNLHVSLPDLQLFAGKEGEDPARRVYPALRRAVHTADMRRALWHAGQVLRQGRLFPGGCLKDFWSVVVCHAALCLWAWGVVSTASSGAEGAEGGERGEGRGGGGGGGGVRYQQQQQQQQQKHQRHAQQAKARRQEEDEGIVFLDGEDSTQVQAWIAYGQGRPAMQSVPDEDGDRGHSGGGGGSSRNGGGNPGKAPGRVCLLEDPRTCMEVAQGILRANFVGVWESLPPLSENIIVVLRQLEEAAWAVGLG